MSADQIFDFANILLLVSLVVGVIATYGIVFSGKIRDRELKRDVAEATERAAVANRGAAEANARAAEANENAEKERLNRIELEAKLAPRRLSAEQKSKFIDLLRAAKPDSIQIASQTLDGESGNFSRDFESAFRESGWNVRWSGAGLFNGTGIVLASGNKPRRDELDLISNALTSIGIEHKILVYSNEPGDGIHLLVQSKPPISEQRNHPVMLND